MCTALIKSNHRVSTRQTYGVCDSWNHSCGLLCRLQISALKENNSSSKFSCRLNQIFSTFPSPSTSLESFHDLLQWNIHPVRSTGVIDFIEAALMAAKIYPGFIWLKNLLPCYLALSLNCFKPADTNISSVVGAVCLTMLDLSRSLSALYLSLTSKRGGRFYFTCLQFQDLNVMLMCFHWPGNLATPRARVTAASRSLPPQLSSGRSKVRFVHL